MLHYDNPFRNMMSAERKRMDTAALKQAINLAAVAEQYTTLTKISHSGELQGPCPFCGGMDRFHVKGERYYCRQCTPRGGDVIDLVMRVEGVSFREACGRLAAGPTSFSGRLRYPTTQPVASAPEGIHWQTETFQDSARRTMAATQRRLMGAEGRAGQDYLTGRGIVPATWVRYKLGYGMTFHPVRREQQGAIFLPWITIDGEQVTAIQHRFLDPQLEKGERYSLKPGSSPLAFGLHALTPAETVVVVEGEFNCMAINQIGVQAVSVGSESSRGRDEVVELLQAHLVSYEEVAVWLDNVDYGRQFAEQLQSSWPFRKEVRVVDAGGLDANEMLMGGELAEVVPRRG